MKKKYKFQKFLNSVIKSHGDIEEDREEIENNVKKMMELFENNNADASGRSEFLSLGNDIKKIFHDLYGRHDKLIGKIKKNVHHKKDESSSECSHSGSEDSSDEDGPKKAQEQKMAKQFSLDSNQSSKEQIDSLSKRNAEFEAQTASMHAKIEEIQYQACEVKDELQAAQNNLKLLDVENEFLKEEISKLKEEEGKLHIQLSGLQEENEVLLSEKEKHSSMLLQIDNSMVGLKSELEKMIVDAEKLRKHNSYLNEELEKRDHELVLLNQQILQKSEEWETLRADAGELQLANDGLSSENASLLIENRDLKAREETAIHQVSNLNGKLLVMEEQNVALKSEVHTLSTSMHEAEKTIKDMSVESEHLKQDNSNLHDTITELTNLMKTKDDENNVLALESSEFKNVIQQAEERIAILLEKEERLRSENSILLARQSNLILELEGKNQELLKLKEALETTELETNSLREEKCLLLTEQENMKQELEGQNQKLSKLKQDFEATELQRNSLIEEKSDLLSRVNEGGMVIDGLKSQIEDAENEKSQLQLKISNLELEIQSANLKFTDVQNALAETELERNSLVEEKTALLSNINEVESEKSQLQLKVSTLINEIQSANLQFSDLKNTLNTTELERKSVVAEKNSLLSKINEDGTIIDGLKFQVEEVENEKSQLQKRICYLELEIQSTDPRFADINNALVAAQEEKKALVSEISVVESKFQESEFAKDRLRTELNELNQKNSILVSRIEEDEKARNCLMFERDEVLTDNAQLEVKVKKLMEEMEARIIQLNQLEKLISIAKEEKTNTLSDISILTDKLHLAESDNEKLAREISLLIDENTAFQQYLEELKSKMIDHNRMMEATSSEMQDLKSKLELVQKEVSHEIQTWNDLFKGELIQIYNSKNSLDQELKSLADISSENEMSLKKMEDRFQKYEELLSEHKQMKDLYSETCTKLETAEKKVEQLEMKKTSIQRLNTICEEQKNEIVKLREEYRKLLENFSYNEVGKADAEKEIQRLEVQIRLANQKLKVTETEYKEKEENWKRLAEEFKEEVKLFKGQILTWSRMSADLNNECKQIKVVLETSIRTLSTEMQDMELTSLENMNSIRKQLAECLVELQKMKTWVESELHEKKKLENENHKLSMEVTYKEGIIFELKDEESKNLAKLSEKEQELKILKRRVVESEKILEEKEREGLDKDEEKREAIRQLCLLIEYHWENHKHLVRHLSLVHRNRGTS